MPERNPETGKAPEKGGGWREGILKEVFDEEKNELVRMSEISIILKEYNDIFSDFDPRPYSQRALSDDFLAEAKKASKVKASEELALMFLVPEDVRKQQNEALIKKRLHDYFKKHHEILNKEIMGTQIKGLKLTLLGFAMLIAATYTKILEMQYPLNMGNIYIFITILLEPAGWFTMWTGLENIFYTWKGKKEDHEFYDKMAKAKISFMSY